MTRQRTDSAEEYVRDYLLSRGHTNIVPEPDGNVPPDLLVDGRIAIEVRRLIQHETVDGRTRGLMESSVPFGNNIRGLLGSFGPPTHGLSWHVFVRFWRPLAPWKDVKDEIVQWLGAFRDGTHSSDLVRVFGKSIEIRLQNRPNRTDTLFSLAMLMDSDDGGLVVANVRESIEHCIKEKSVKIAAYRDRYPEWWLAVTDHIGLGNDEMDISQLKAVLPRKGAFDRVLIIGADGHFEF